MTLTWTDCVEIILNQNHGPMHVEQIVKAILSQNLYNPTHDRGDGVDKNTCTQLIYQEIDNKNENRFVRVELATFALRRNYDQDQLALYDAAMESDRAALKRAGEKTVKAVKTPGIKRAKAPYTINGFTVVRWKA